MTKYEVLNQLKHKEINNKEAYNLLFKKGKDKKPKRARFVRVKVKIPDSRAASVLMSVLLFLPMPLFLIKLFIPKRIKHIEGNVRDDIPFTAKELIELASHRGVKIDVKSNDGVKVLIKTI